MIGDPGRYAVPQVGQQLGQAIADLPNAFMQGRQQARQRAMEDAFKDGVPRNPDGSLDSNAVIDKGMRIGGLPFAQPLLQYMLDLEAGKAWSGAIPSEQGQTGPAPPGSAAGPGNLAGGAQPTRPAMRPQGAPPPQPRLSTAGADSEGAQTINSLASEVFGERDVTEALPRYAAAVGNKLGEPLTPDQEQRARALMQRSSRLLGKTRVASSEDVVPPSGPTSAAEVGMNDGSRPPFMGGAGTGLPRIPTLGGGPASGAPAPAGGTAPNAVAQAGPGMAGMDNAGAGGAPGIRQTPVGTAEDARVAFTRATNMRKAALAMPSTNPGRQKALLDQAQAEQTRGENILKSLADYNAPTGEQKNASDVMVQRSEGLKVAQKHELDAGDNLNKGLQGAAREFETALKPHLDAMRGILNDPNFVSGTGVGFQEALNKIRSNPLFQGLPGYDPNAALPNEALRKVVAASVLNQTTELKAEAAEMGGSAGRLFQQQISLMEKAAQNPESTAPALRYLTELQQRMGDHARAVAELASNYEGKYGRGVLDNGFNRVLSKFNSDPKNQIFRPGEIADPRTFAPPVAPVVHDKAEALAWADKAGIRPGDPIKIASTGRVIPFDPGKFK
jgi:hypothetical protein